jgi:uncharacterized protein (TIGR03083 family)
MTALWAFMKSFSVGRWTMPDALDALQASVERLARLAGPLGDEVVMPAYPSAWTIADVLSHLGSGAVIWQRRLDDALAERNTPSDVSERVWSEWNAKTPRAKVDDALAADAGFTAQLRATSQEDRSSVTIRLGPIDFHWDQIVGARLNEHVLHEWDVAVALDPGAVLAADGSALVVDNLELVARYTAKPVGPPGQMTIATFEPARWFALSVTLDDVTFGPAEAVPDPRLTLPAEAFIRLVYGRLDPDHTPASVVGDGEVLEQLRQVFPGP